MFKISMGLAALLVCSLSAPARPPSPFKVSASIAGTNQPATVRVEIFVPADHLVYADHLHFENAAGETLEPFTTTTPKELLDPVTHNRRAMFDRSFFAELRLDQILAEKFMVRLQGCSNSACHFPEKHYFKMESGGVCVETSAPDVPAAAIAVTETPNDLGSLLAKFKVVSQKTGFVPARDFANYLEQAKTGGVLANDDPLAGYERFGIVATLLLILLGGIGLNLTPCVLPLIPINLAIIGAGKAAPTRRAGFLQGAAYGLGMSLAYGALGIIVVLTGAKFGALNSSVWFNLVIALVFLAMSLAMFDMFHIDFTRFDRRLGRRESRAAHDRKSKGLVAFTLGAIAALLAGACVAPVVISVLLMAANLYAKGLVVGLLLPLLLGVGMALPWPFLGASLSFLPKPGRWMTGVKYVFGVLILVFAGYYGWLAFGLARTRNSQTLLAAAPGVGNTAGDVNGELSTALKAALASNKPVFIDFKASWCKNCEAMDATVFTQAAVRHQLADFVVVQYQAERPNESPAKDILDRFGILGLPTYLVLAAEK